MTDYQTFTTRSTPQHERDKLNVGPIWSNAVRCTKCGDVIRSKNRHDMTTCSCRSVSVDGGSWYVKVVAQARNDFEYLTEFYDDAKEDSAA